MDYTLLGTRESTTELREYGTMNRDQRKEQLIQAAKRLQRRRSRRYRGYNWEQILAEEIYYKLNRKWRDHVYGHTPTERKLYPIVKWVLRDQFEKVYDTHENMGDRWPDIYAVKRSLGRIQTVSIEAKTRYSEFKRFHEQSFIYAKHSNRVYLAATPGLVAEAGKRLGQGLGQGERQFKKFVEEAKAGIYLVDYTARDARKITDPPENDRFDKTQQKQILTLIGYRKA